MKKNHIYCKRCLMDNSVSDFFQTENGCNYCEDFLTKLNLQTLNESNEDNFKELLHKIKRLGKGKTYDCVVGISGGVDSSWVLVKAVEQGLRVLAVHMDNGWNSELSQSNINNLVSILGVDLETYVIDWNEYRKMMQAFFNSDVIDVELLYDNAMLGVNYKYAKKYGIKYILSGDNKRTEGFNFPQGWNWLKLDKTNILSICRKWGVESLRSFPFFGIIDYFFNRYLFKIRWTPILDYFVFDKNEALKTLIKKYNYKPYPYKHYESIFTRFYQGFILPMKFNVDKRKLHLSALILTGQLTRGSAIEFMNEIAYPSIEELNSDRNFFLSKMNWTDNELEDYLLRPEKPHDFYPSGIKLWKLLKKIHKFLFNNTQFE